MPRAVPVSRLAYWKEREARWQAFAQTNGGDYAAFANTEKPFVAKQRAIEKAEKAGRKRPLSIPTATANCVGGETPKMVFGTPRCVPEEKQPMSDVLDRMRSLAGITSAYPEMDRPSGMDEVASGEADKTWDALSKNLDATIGFVRKILGGKPGDLGPGEVAMLTRLLNASREVQKSWDGD